MSTVSQKAWDMLEYYQDVSPGFVPNINDVERVRARFHNDTGALSNAKERMQKALVSEAKTLSKQGKKNLKMMIGVIECALGSIVKDSRPGKRQRRSAAKKVASEVVINGNDGLEMFPCTQCKRKFTNAKNLNMHVLQGHVGGLANKAEAKVVKPAPVNVGRIPCTHCKRSFKTLDGLDMHVAMQHQANSKPVVKDVDDKAAAPSKLISNVEAASGDALEPGKAQVQAIAAKKSIVKDVSEGGKLLSQVPAAKPAGGSAAKPAGKSYAGVVAGKAVGQPAVPHRAGVPVEERKASEPVKRTLEKVAAYLAEVKPKRLDTAKVRERSIMVDGIPCIKDGSRCCGYRASPFLVKNWKLEDPSQWSRCASCYGLWLKPCPECDSITPSDKGDKRGLVCDCGMYYCTAPKASLPTDFVFSDVECPCKVLAEVPIFTRLSPGKSPVDKAGQIVVPVMRPKAVQTDFEFDTVESERTGAYTIKLKAEAIKRGVIVGNSIDSNVTRDRASARVAERVEEVSSDDSVSAVGDYRTVRNIVLGAADSLSAAQKKLLLFDLRAHLGIDFIKPGDSAWKVPAGGTSGDLAKAEAKAGNLSATLAKVDSVKSNAKVGPGEGESKAEAKDKPKSKAKPNVGVKLSTGVPVTLHPLVDPRRIVVGKADQLFGEGDSESEILAGAKVAFAPIDEVARLDDDEFLEDEYSLGCGGTDEVSFDNFESIDECLDDFYATRDYIKRESKPTSGNKAPTSAAPVRPLAMDDQPQRTAGPFGEVDPLKPISKDEAVRLSKAPLPENMGVVASNLRDHLLEQIRYTPRDEHSPRWLQKLANQWWKQFDVETFGYGPSSRAIVTAAAIAGALPMSDVERVVRRVMHTGDVKETVEAWKLAKKPGGLGFFHWVRKGASKLTFGAVSAPGKIDGLKLIKDAPMLLADADTMLVPQVGYRSGMVVGNQVTDVIMPAVMAAPPAMEIVGDVAAAVNAGSDNVDLN